MRATDRPVDQQGQTVPAQKSSVALGLEQVPSAGLQVPAM
jgi:hypothetical protein